MKTIRWIGATLAAVGSVVVIALTTGANAADVIVVRSIDPQPLTTGQQAALRSWVVSVWPAAPEADIDKLTCQRSADDDSGDAVVVCSAYRTSLLTAEQYAVAEASRKAVGAPETEDIAPDGSTVVTRIRVGKKRLSPSEVSTLASGASTVFGIPAATMKSVSFHKTEGVVWGNASYLDTLSPVQRLICRRAKTCGKVVGVVE